MATAPITRDISLTGWTMSEISVFTDSTQAAQLPTALCNAPRWLMRPS